MSFTSCDNYETYAEKKDNEREAIQSYLKKQNARILSEEEFKARGCVTDTAAHEWVLLTQSSVYMQVVNKGTYYDPDIYEKENGRLVELDGKIKPGETHTILCRFNEYNLFTNSLTCTNNSYSSTAIPEKMTVTRSTDTYTGSFVTGSSQMLASYGTASVPTGWLVAMPYINLGRVNGTRENKAAEVKLIVPHSQGQPSATSGVIPCLYEIEMMEGQ